MNRQPIISWLLEGDVSIQYQVYRDLLGKEREDLRERIEKEGWGRRFLSLRNPDMHWGKTFYQPKWTSTHYTLLDLRNLCLRPNNEIVQETLANVLRSGKAKDGGIPLGPSTRKHSDVCVNGMFLNYASYFRIPEEDLYSLVDMLLSEIMPDGGFNCRTSRTGATHSSLHSTISVLEGLTQFQAEGHEYRAKEILIARESAVEFILLHRLYLSDRSGKIIHPDFLKLTYPCRWRYDILRALAYFQKAEVPWDNRMLPAMEVLAKKRNRDASWNMQARHSGKVHFEMEKAGRPSRWNTLRALRVWQTYGHHLYGNT